MDFALPASTAMMLATASKSCQLGSSFKLRPLAPSRISPLPMGNLRCSIAVCEKPSKLAP